MILPIKFFTIICNYIIITHIKYKLTEGKYNMANLVKIGNSQGIRIPKALIEQAHLEDKELKLQIVKDGLLVSPSKKTTRRLEGGYRSLIGNSWQRTS